MSELDKKEFYIGLKNNNGQKHLVSLNNKLDSTAHRFFKETNELSLTPLVCNVFISSTRFNVVDIPKDVWINQKQFIYGDKEVFVCFANSTKNHHPFGVCPVFDLDLVGGSTTPCLFGEVFAKRSDQKDHWPTVGYMYNQHLRDSMEGSDIASSIGPIILSARNIFGAEVPLTVNDMIFEMMNLDATGLTYTEVPDALEEVFLAYYSQRAAGNTNQSICDELDKKYSPAFVWLAFSLFEKVGLVSVGFALPGRLSNLGKLICTYWKKGSEAK